MLHPKIYIRKSTNKIATPSVKVSLMQMSLIDRMKISKEYKLLPQKHQPQLTGSRFVSSFDSTAVDIPVGQNFGMSYLDNYR